MNFFKKGSKKLSSKKTEEKSIKEEPQAVEKVEAPAKEDLEQKMFDQVPTKSSGSKTTIPEEEMTETTFDEHEDSLLESPSSSPVRPKSTINHQSFNTNSHQRVNNCTPYGDGGRAFNMSWSDMERAVIVEREKRHRARELQIYGYERNKAAFEARAAMFENKSN